MISDLQNRIDTKIYKIENIRICDIKLSDETFKISSDSDNDISALAASINTIGIINMPMVKLIKDRYIVISGFKRIQAVKLIGITQIQAVVIEFDDKLCACLAIADNAFQRPLNIMEQVRGVSLLKRFVSSNQKIIENFPKIFNSKINAQLINIFSDIAAMPKSLHKLIESDKISINSAAKFKQYGYDNDLIELFAAFFLKIRTSLSKQKEIITNIHEIAARENISVIDVIESNELKQILDSNENDANKKGNLLRLFLFQRRYPNLSKAKEEFAMKLKRLNLDGKEGNLNCDIKLAGDIKLEPPADFEGKDYIVTFRFSNRKEFEEKIENLKSVSETGLLYKLIENREYTVE